MEEQLFYIKNRFIGNTIVWWAKDGHGYTTDLSKAWKVKAAWHSDRKEDVKYPCDLVDKAARLTVSIEDLPRGK